MAYKKTVQTEEEKKEKCGCGCGHENCNCEHEHEHDHCNCGHEHHNCGCGHDHCKDDCDCEHGNCTCGDEPGECHCHDCECDSNKKDLAEEYLTMARVIQADFDNYRKRSIESIKKAKQDGTISAVECILPCIDVFKSAKDMIKDASALKGIEMVETEMLSALSKLGVNKIETKGAMFDPNLHNALSVMENKDLKDGQIIEEYKAGYTIGDKVIRYSQVIVNKLREDK